MKLLIADDHAVVRRGLRHMLEDALGPVEVLEAADGGSVLALSPWAGIDLLVLDIGMPGPSWLEVLDHVRRTAAALPVLVLSLHTERAYARRALRAGARGYVTKEKAPEDLIAAVRAVVGGQRYVSASLRDAGEDTIAPTGQGSAILSRRERDVLLNILNGRPPKEIARLLGLSVKTVSTFRTRLLRKVGVSSNVELARWAAARGIR